MKVGFPCCDSGAFSDAKAVVVEKVRTEVTELEPGVTTAGEKEQDSPAGGFEQESETAWSKDPDFAATTMLDEAPWPGVRLTDDGEEARVIVAAAGAGGGATGQLVAYGITPDIWFVRLGLPTD